MLLLVVVVLILIELRLGMNQRWATRISRRILFFLNLYRGGYLVTPSMRACVYRSIRNVQVARYGYALIHPSWPGASLHLTHPSRETLGRGPKRPASAKQTRRPVTTRTSPSTHPARHTFSGNLGPVVTRFPLLNRRIPWTPAVQG